jgi:hypothetical protein
MSHALNWAATGLFQLPPFVTANAAAAKTFFPLEPESYLRILRICPASFIL